MEKPDFTKFSEERKVELLNTLYDSEKRLIAERDTFENKLRAIRTLYLRIQEKHEEMQDDFDAYANGEFGQKWY